MLIIKSSASNFDMGEQYEQWPVTLTTAWGGGGEWGRQKGCGNEGFYDNCKLYGV